MYQGNEHKKSRRKTRKSTKSITLLALFLLLVCVTIGGTVAFLVATDVPVTNEFTLLNVTTEVEENLEGTVKSNVKIKNTGDADAYIRAAVVVTWQDSDGNVYGQMPTACKVKNCDHTDCGKDYAIVYNLASGTGKGWKQKDDFYYWTEPVKGVYEEADGSKVYSSTGTLITSCSPIKEAPAEGFYLNVEIIGSGIQAEGTDKNGNKPIELAWGVDIDDNGNLIKATIEPATN